jgi:N-acetylmuramoyl-L-alanine amidase
MKKLAALLLLLAVVCCPGANLQTPRVERLSIAGKEYVRLDQWARANGFQFKWASKQEAVLQKGTTRIELTAELKRMSVNGVLVILSEPVRNYNGSPCMASVDLTTALQPILFPPKGRPRSTVKHICIDPGHGGKQTGYIVSGEPEKKYTLLLAQELGAQLRQAGYTVSYTRTTDTLVDWGERPEMARRRGADMFISLHFNSAGYTSAEARGVEVYCMTPQRARSTNDRGEGGNSGAYLGNLNNPRNMVLAYELQKAITRGTGLEDRGVKRARFEVLRDAQMPAVLIEGGFMSNPTEARKIFSPIWRKQMAQAIAAGIGNYRRIVEP